MSVSRSALASSAARSACAASDRPPSRAPIARAIGAHALDAFAHASRAWRGRPPCRAAARATRASSCGPGRRRTCASARRGRTTRSLPWITALGSSGRMLLTTRNWFVSGPRLSSSGKYFWLAFIVRIRHSGGTARNSRLEPAQQHVRAARPAPSPRRAGPRRRSASGPARAAAAAAGAAISARRCVEAGDHRALALELLARSVGVAQLDRLATRLEAVAVRLRPASRPSARTGTTSRAMQRDQAVRRPHEAARWSSRRRAGSSSPWGSAARQRLVERVLQARRKRRAGHHASRNSASRLAVDASRVSALDGDVRRRRPARKLLQQRRRRLAVGVEADGHRHQLAARSSRSGATALHAA